MSLSELVSTLTPSSGAQVGVVVFAALFALICVRLWSRHEKATFDAAELLPLADDDPPLRSRDDGRGAP
jgi:cbb3-type cytochrome oxidase subunit 3